ncbi:MAG: DUF5675 family protein [Candidatus Fonsibacter ubiquis]
MQEVILNRYYTNNGDLKIKDKHVYGATIGYLQIKCKEKSPPLFTLERPLFYNGKSNQRETKQTIGNTSTCIPIGEYQCIFNLSNKFQIELYLLLDVDGRRGIRIHAGNHINDLLGCIAIGKRFVNNVATKNYVYDYYLSESQKGLQEFYDLTKKEPIKLIIKDDDQDKTKKIIQQFNKSLKI